MPKSATDTPDELCKPVLGAPRIHGELLKLGLAVSQATVGRYLPRRPKTPSATWRSFLQNHLADTVAIDMFIVATATFRILYALIVLDHDRRKIIHFGVAENPTQMWLSHQITKAFPWDTAPHCVGQPISGSPVKIAALDFFDDHGNRIPDKFRSLAHCPVADNRPL